MIGTIFLFGLWAGSVAGHESGEHVIEMRREGFESLELAIEKNETVIFNNFDTEAHWPASNDHPTHEAYGAFDPGRPIPAGESWAFTFEQAGTWEFHDHLYPHLTGVVVVREQSAEIEETKSEASPSFVERFMELARRVFGWFFGLFARDQAKEQQIESPGDQSAKQQIQQLGEYDREGLYQGVVAACDSGEYSCWLRELRRVTRESGPSAAVEVLSLSQERGTIERTLDDHQLIHQVGRQTAETFGVNAESFLYCPMSAYNGGCQHGFFEYVLGKTPSTAEAADTICATLGDSFSSKFKFYCYHGVGHGVMMAQAYDLSASLEICDSLSSSTGQEGCWQGVFMENVNAGMRGEARSGVFTAEDPLAPCNKIEEKYRQECYINHAGWLMRVFGNDVSQASTACLDAPGGHRRACLESIGLMVTNQTWQLTLTPVSSASSFTDRAWELCQAFPQGYRETCMIGAVDNLMNFDEKNTTRSEQFCSRVSLELQEQCFVRIGVSVSAQSVKEDEIEATCAGLRQEQTREWCLRGAS